MGFYFNYKKIDIHNIYLSFKLIYISFAKYHVKKSTNNVCVSEIGGYITVNMTFTYVVLKASLTSMFCICC